MLLLPLLPARSAVHLSAAEARLVRDSLILLKGTIPPGDSLVSHAACSRAALARGLVN
jgi:hypothetical protein